MTTLNEVAELVKDRLRADEARAIDKDVFGEVPIKTIMLLWNDPAVGVTVAVPDYLLDRETVEEAAGFVEDMALHALVDMEGWQTVIGGFEWAQRPPTTREFIEDAIPEGHCKVLVTGRVGDRKYAADMLLSRAFLEDIPEHQRDGFFLTELARGVVQAMTGREIPLPSIASWQTTYMAEPKIGLGELAEAVRELVGADDVELRVEQERWVEFVFTWGDNHVSLTLQAGFLSENSEQKTAELIAGMVDARRRKRGWL